MLASSRIGLAVVSCAIAALPLNDRFWHQLVSFRLAAEAELSALEDSVVMPLSLLMVICVGEILMVLDRHRRPWGLPGGLRERGESARQAAGCELAEATGVSAAELKRDKRHRGARIGQIDLSGSGPALNGFDGLIP